MSQAEDLFNRADESDAVRILAEEMCVSYEEKIMGDVHYTLFEFSDKSILTWGSNGYVGSETP